jgi:hypothetical protein
VLASDYRKPNGQYVITPEMGPAFVLDKAEQGHAKRAAAIQAEFDALEKIASRKSPLG